MTPDFRAYVRRHLPPLAIRPEREIEIVDELAAQLEQAWDAAARAGASDAEAWARVAAEIPDWRALAATLSVIEKRVADQARDDILGTARGALLRGIVADFRYAVRRLRHTPVHSAAAIAVLALALGLGAAAFALIDGILIRPLAYPDASRLVLLRATVPPEGRLTDELTLPDIQDLGASGVFADTAALIPFGGTTTSTDPPSRIEGFEVSPSFFRVLDIRPALGRALQPEDATGHTPVAVISHAQWQRMGEPADVIGRAIAVNEVSRVIVGVTPPGLTIDILPHPADVFLPITPQHPFGANRGIRAARAIARLKDPLADDAVTAALAALGDRLATAFPGTNRGRSFSVRSLQDAVVGPARAQLWLVASLVGLVMLVAAVNVAGLMMTRTVGRLREIAVRLTLGASRWRLVREAIAEAIVVTAIGATLGALLGESTLRVLRTVPEVNVPRLAEVTMSVRPVVALALMALMLACAAGLAPVMLRRRLCAVTSLRGGHETISRRAVLARSALIVGQTAFVFLLLATTVLLATGLRTLLAQPLGFETRNIVTLRIAVPETRYRTRDETVQFFTAFLDEIGARPGIQRAGVASNLPLAGNTGSTLSIQGRDAVPLALRPTVGWNWASPGYFGAIGMPIVRGRTFVDADRTRLPHVTVINETLARLYFPGEDPIGQRVYFGGYGPEGPPEWHEIIGVVGDVRHRQLDAPPDARAYDLFGQHWGRTVSLAVRTADAPLHVAGLVRQELARRDPQLAVFAVQTTADLVSRATAMRRLLLSLVTVFAAIGLTLSFVGLYGTLSYLVTERTRELGVRMALGATTRSIRSLVLSRGLGMTAIGLAIGLAGLVTFRRLLEGQLAGVSPLHPPAIAIAVLTLLVPAASACLIPAARATRINPTDALKSE